MPGKEYKARDKTVSKMSRDGLMEENLRTGEKIASGKQSKDASIRARPGMEGQKTADDPVLEHFDISLETESDGQPGRAALSVEDGDSIADSDSVEGTLGNKRRRVRQKRLSAEKLEGGKAGGTDGKSRSDAYEAGNLDDDAEPDAAARNSRKKRQVQEYHRQELQEEESYVREKLKEDSKGAKSRLRDTVTVETEDLADFREEIEGKTKRERLNREQRKKTAKQATGTSKDSVKKTRLSFDDEEGGMVKGSGMGPGKHAVSGVAAVSSATVHRKLYEADGDNTAVEAAHSSELAAEESLRVAGHHVSQKRNRQSLTEMAGEDEITSGRLKFGTGDSEAAKAAEKAAQTEKAKKVQVRKFWQKRQYKEAYAASAQGKKTAEKTYAATQTVSQKARNALKETAAKNHSLLVGIGIFALLFMLIAASLSSCSALLQGGSTTVISTTYSSTDDDIYAVENAYTALEAALQEQINTIESRHTGYDEYNYQIDEIGHNPYLLISYFTARYGEFTYEQVAEEVEEIFQLQYAITLESETETVTETRTVRVGESLGQVVTSGYCSCAICCGSWAGGPTASGVYPTANHTIAVDASNPIVPIGTKIVMNGVEYTVEDTGNLSTYGVDFDVYYDSHSLASAHGHQTWEAYIADDNGSEEVEVTTTEVISRLNVTMTNSSLDTILRSRMSTEEVERYNLYNYTYGNRSDLFDVTTISTADGLTYTIPEEALSDEKFANMIQEAEKYLGTPYVWGGYSPSGFDCSGFVSYVINNCGNGWSYGRLTANGLMGICDIIAASEAQPGDLVFFQGTYNTSGASHVGIYVGNGMMIHCGNPVKYTSIETSYWQEHLYCFGRIRS